MASENLRWFISGAVFWDVYLNICFVFFISFCWLKEVAFYYFHVPLVMSLYA